MSVVRLSRGGSKGSNIGGVNLDGLAMYNGFACADEEAEPLYVREENVAAFSLPVECFSFTPKSETIISTFKNGDKERKVHCNIELSPTEVEQLETLRKLAKDKGVPFAPSISLMATRYISRARGDAVKALMLMQKTQQWRQRYYQDGPLSDHPDHGRSVWEDLQYGICYWAGRDSELRPLIVVRANRVPKKWYKENSVDKMLRVLIFCMEYFLRYMCIPGKVENNCVLVDLKGLGVTGVPVKLLGEVYSVLNNFSGRVYKFYICNMSWGLKGLTGVVSALLTDRQKQKLCFIDNLAELQKDIGRHHLEEDLGGTRPVHTKFYPFPLAAGPFNLNSTVSDAQAVPNIHRALTAAGARGRLWEVNKTKEENECLEYTNEAYEILTKCKLPIPPNCPRPTPAWTTATTESNASEEKPTKIAAEVVTQSAIENEKLDSRPAEKCKVIEAELLAKNDAAELSVAAIQQRHLEQEQRVQTLRAKEAEATQGQLITPIVGSPRHAEYPQVSTREEIESAPFSNRDAKVVEETSVKPKGFWICGVCVSKCHKV